MKTTGYWLVIALISCLCGLAGSACKLTKGKMKDKIHPEVLEGDISLPERIEEGDRVAPEEIETDAIQFLFDSYQIPEAELWKIEKVAAFMKRNRNVRLIMEGHCDERGSREYNMSLGEHRALAARARLIGLGVESDRIQTRSYGEERPVDLGHSSSAWRRNRRGDFILYR